VLFVDGIPTLANVVIIDPIQIDLVSYVVSFCKVVIIVVVQAKEGLYHNWHLKSFSFFGSELTSCYLLMTFAHWPMLSLPIPPELIWFHMSLCVTEWLQQWWLRQKKMLS
jgi:hypothetical protein